ncbi:MAG: hypothetical protein WCZ17_07200, partial [Candidatus Kapaibacterium sp.]
SDKLLASLLRENKNIGSKERRFISETIFTVMRNLTFISNSSKNIFPQLFFDNFRNEFLYVLSLLLLSDDDRLSWAYHPKQLLSKIYPNKDFQVVDFILEIFNHKNFLTLEYRTNWISNAATSSKSLSINYLENKYIDDISSISEILSCPKWILDHVVEQGVSPSKFAESLTVPANICLRASDPSIYKHLENMLDGHGIVYSKSNMLPGCYILAQRAKIDNSEEYRKGFFEFQDEGSQLIGLALSPNGKCTILDACAGAGGKTLQIASLCPEADEIVASDVEYLRIKEFSVRLRRYRHENIAIKHAKSMNYEHLDNVFQGRMFDYVLIDAPCTGLGTARRDPLKKFRVSEKLAEKMHLRQVEILDMYSKFVKPGGILVYATCSVLMHENQNTVSKFLESNPAFEPDRLKPVFELHGVYPEGLSDDAYCLTLFPHIHGTDGFFMARMKKRD